MDIHDEIEIEAYSLYVKSGKREGHDLENWFEAEKIVMGRHSAETEEAVVEEESHPEPQNTPKTKR